LWTFFDSHHPTCLNFRLHWFLISCRLIVGNVLNACQKVPTSTEHQWQYISQVPPSYCCCCCSSKQVMKLLLLVWLIWRVNWGLMIFFRLVSWEMHLFCRCYDLTWHFLDSWLVVIRALLWELSQGGNPNVKVTGGTIPFFITNITYSGFRFHLLPLLYPHGLTAQGNNIRNASFPLAGDNDLFWILRWNPGKVSTVRPYLAPKESFLVMVKIFHLTWGPLF